MEKIDNIWYFFNNSGAMQTRWIKLNGIWYYLNSSGMMQTGWLKLGNTWYYLKSSGAMAVGWNYVGNHWYYLYESGAMAHDTYIGAYYVDSSGARIVDAIQKEMDLKANSYSSSTSYLILVDTSQCRVSIYTGKQGAWSNIQYYKCAPGKASTPTVKGVFTVQAKGRYFGFGNSRCYWYTQFYGNYLFHSTLYNKNGTIQDNRTGIPLSHGCVRLEIQNAKWIYDNIPRGTKVIVS